jgi:hypothetical protein
MKFQISPNKLNNSKTSYEFLDNQKLLVLVWENWSWKSSILEEILRNNILSNEKIVISYSSWTNETFSWIFEKWVKMRKTKTWRSTSKTKKKEYLWSFHFDRQLWDLIIFLAYSLKNWNVKNFINTKLKHSEAVLYTHLEFDLKIRQSYINKLNYDREKFETWESNFSLETSEFHNILNQLINKLLFLKEGEEFSNVKYDFEESLFLNNASLVSDDSVYVFNKDPKSLINFISLFTKWNEFIWKKWIRFLINDDRNQFSIKDLSDWEYQLLMIKSLIDLFDSGDTLFLFDEIDSHLHYSNIKVLRDCLKTINWKAITSTHISESILNSENLNHIKYVEKWIFNEAKNTKELIWRIWLLVNDNKFIYSLLSREKNIIIMDDLDDWDIFLTLIKAKLWEKAYNRVKDIYCHKTASSYNNTNETFWKWKLEFISELENYNWNIFLICDRDKLPLTEINDNLSVNIPSVFKKKFWRKRISKIHLLSWKRLEIENYLLTKNLLINNWEFSYLKFEELVTLDNLEDIATFDAKKIAHTIYKNWEQYDEYKLKRHVEKIPIEEISEDITLMYSYLVDNISND